MNERRRALMPAVDIPMLDFGFAHVCLAAAFIVLIVDPSLAGPFFLHPRMVAVVHLVTLGWISASIVGAFYIVAPLALRMPFGGGWLDRGAFAAFAIGVVGMVTQFWSAQYGALAWPASLVRRPCCTWRSAPGGDWPLRWCPGRSSFTSHSHLPT